MLFIKNLLKEWGYISIGLWILMLISIWFLPNYIEALLLGLYFGHFCTRYYYRNQIDKL